MTLAADGTAYIAYHYHPDWRHILKVADNAADVWETGAIEEVFGEISDEYPMVPSVKFDDSGNVWIAYYKSLGLNLAGFPHPAVW